MRSPYATYLFVFATSIFSLFLLSSCATQRINPLLELNPKETDISQEAVDSKKETQLWNHRYQKPDLEEFLKLQEPRAKTANATREQMIKISRAHFLLAEYFDASSDEKQSHWEAGANWAEKALTLNPQFKARRVQQKIPSEQCLDTLKAKDGEALYWFAANLGEWAKSQGLNTILKYKDRVKKMIDRAQELAPHYLFGAIYRYYGAYYASIPGFNAEDLNNSKKNFEKAIRKYPEYFGNHVMYAQYYAAKVKDIALYKKQLKWTIQGNPKTLREFYAEQFLDQEKAKKLLQTIPEEQEQL